MTDPFVIAAVALPRSDWLSRIGHWASSASLPIELTRCLSTTELLALIASGKRLSAVLIDPTVPGADRDLIDNARKIGAPTIAVSTRRAQRDLTGIGFVEILPDSFTAAELIGVLDQHSAPIPRGAPRQVRLDAALVDAASSGHLVAVMGSGGVGSTTVSMMAAQSLADGLGSPQRAAANRRSVALVDGSLRANMSMYHDVGDIIPSISELVELHRMDEPDPDAIRSLLFNIPERNYSLLLGMRRPRDWATMRAASTRSAINGLTRCYDVVVVDHDDSCDGEAETGSLDVEERHVIARHTLSHANAVICVGTTGMKGMYDLSWLIQEAVRLDVAPDKIIPVINFAPRRPALRASLSRTLIDATGITTHPAVFIPFFHRMEDTQRSVSALPQSRPITQALHKILDMPRNSRQPATSEPARVEQQELRTVGITAQHDEVA